MKKIFAILVLVSSTSLMAVEYFKITDDHKLAGISEADFSGCATKIFRSSTGNKDLSADNKKAQLTAALKGQAKDSMDSIKMMAPGSCTYGEASEK